MRSLLLSVLTAGTVVSCASPDSPAATFAQFVDDYLDAWAARHPSIAAGNGIHQHDDLLDDFSAPAIEREIERLKQDREQLRAFSSKDLTPDERVDRRILYGIIDGWLLEQETVQNWRRNPMLYASALSDGVHNLMIQEYAPAPVRMRRVVAKLSHVADLLEAARTNVTNPPRLFAERGAGFMRGVSDMLQHDLPLAFASQANTPLMDSLMQAARTATPLIDDYVTWLERDVIPNATGDFAIGGDNVARRYAGEDLIDMPLAEMLALGEREMMRNQADFRAAAAEIAPERDAVAVWRDVRRDHPRRGQLVAATQAVVDSLTAFVAAKDLATVPTDERVIVAPAPAFDLGFASMHASPPLERKPLKSFYYITDADSAQPRDQQEAWLERFNYASLAITSAHEAMPGHWLHSIYMRRTPGKVRRIWIGLNPFPQPSSGQDGWAHYTEQLVVDEGFASGDPRYRLAQISDALTRICRLLSGIRLHTHEWTLDDAQACFEHQAYLAAPAARREAERGTYDPTYGGYFLGKMALLALRRDYQAALGADFNLRAFHERVMSNGIAPIWAHRELMLPSER